MINNFDQIATVSITLSSAVADSTSFDNILIVGPLPAVATTVDIPDCGVYTDIEAVTDMGWVVSGEEADPVGVAALVAFSQNPRPARIFIAPIRTVTETVEGQQVTSEEPVVTTVTRAMATSGWYAVCPAGVSSSQIALLAAYIEAQEKMMVYTDNDFFSSTGKDANTTSVANTYYRSVAVFGKENSAQLADNVPEANAYANVAFACAWLANRSGSETAAFKAIAGIKAGDFSATEITNLDNGRCNYINEIGGKIVTMLGKTLAGEWCDIIRFRDWLKNDIQVAVANIFLTTPKVPYTDAGIALIQNAIETSLRRGQENGGIMENEYDDDGNETVGFVVRVPAANSIPDSDKAARRLTGITFSARLAGAIHFASITGTVSYSI